MYIHSADIHQDSLGLAYAVQLALNRRSIREGIYRGIGLFSLDLCGYAFWLRLWDVEFLKTGTVYRMKSSSTIQKPVSLVYSDRTEILTLTTAS